MHQSFIFQRHGFPEATGGQMLTEDEKAKRRRMMAEAAERMDRRSKETDEILRRRLADKIQASIEQAGEGDSGRWRCFGRWGRLKPIDDDVANNVVDLGSAAPGLEDGASGPCG